MERLYKVAPFQRVRKSSGSIAGTLERTAGTGLDNAFADAPISDQQPPAKRRPEDLLGYLSSSATRIGRYSRARHPVGKDLNTDSERSQDPHDRGSQLEQLRHLTARGDLQAAWTLYLKSSQRRSRPNSRNDSPFQDVIEGQWRDEAFRLLVATIQVWLRGDKAIRQDMITPVNAYHKLNRHGHMLPGAHGHMLWTMVIFLEKKFMGYGGQAFPLAIVNQILLVWTAWVQEADRGPVENGSEHSTGQTYDDAEANETIQEEGQSQAVQAATRIGAFLSPARWDAAVQADPKQDFATTFHRLVEPFEDINASMVDKSLASALCMYDMLTHVAAQSGVPETRLSRYAPFVKDMKTLLTSTAMSEQTKCAFVGRIQHSRLDDRIARRILHRAGQRQSRPLATAHQKLYSEESSHRTRIERFITDLGRASAQKNLESVEKLWTHVQTYLKSVELTEDKMAAVTKMYEQFMLAFLQMRKTDTAMVVWNGMIQSGISPTVSTWTVMLKGCQLGREPKIMENLWYRMRQSNIQPDLHAWSTRIFGLFRMNKHLEGRRALDDMATEWEQAVKRRSKSGEKVENIDSVEYLDGVPRPNTIILNSAIAALASQGRQHIGRLLAWSRTHDITPDVITYNSLMNVAFSNDEPEEATEILHRMVESGIKPDSATFTVILTSLFHNRFLADLSPSEQTTRIMSFIASLENEGLVPDDRGYALMIDRLIKDYNNIAAAHTVLAHMRSHSIEPTPHIYTILMTHCFQQDPPDLLAADTLWNQIISKKHYQESVDVIFYDRMIEGYARHGDVGRMMSFLGRMSKEGKRPGWLAMTAVVRCLAERAEWERIREIVVDVRETKGLASAGMRGIKGQSEFWGFVKGLQMR